MTNEKTLNKIRALLAKTIENGCTEAEAMAALEIAQKLMIEHEISLEDLKLEDEKAIVARSDMRDPQNVRWQIAYWIAQFTETLPFGHKKSIKFAGLKGDVDFAVWLCDTLAAFVHAELKRYMWSNGYQKLQGNNRIQVQNSFVRGCCARINSKLHEMANKRHVSANSNAIAVAKSAMIDDIWNELGVKDADNRGRKKQIQYGSVYRAGAEAGEKASFGRPVETGGMLRLEQK